MPPRRQRVWGAELLSQVHAQVNNVAAQDVLPFQRAAVTFYLPLGLNFPQLHLPPPLADAQMHFWKEFMRLNTLRY